LKRLFAWLLLWPATPVIYAHKIEVQTGSLKGDFTPTPDYAITTYKHGPFRAGAFTSPNAQGVVASYSSTDSPFLLELGQREKSIEQGFLVSNGAYLPWTRNFAFAEPIGVRTGLRMRYAGAEAFYYQRDVQSLTAALAHISPFSWFRFSGGAGLPDANLSTKPFPLAAIAFGEIGNSFGTRVGGEFAGEGNFLAFARYQGDFTLRGLAFRRSSEGPLASGIFGFSSGGAVQWMSKSWFAQYFQTDSRFGMLRYGGDYLSAVLVYEERNPLAGFSLRSGTGFHLRAGATAAADSGLQTLAGLGFADVIFIGGGHYSLLRDQPLEPVIFPAEWYSSLLLQSSSMRLRDRGFKMLALVQTGAVQGFVAVTYSEDTRGRERFGFFMRLAGSLAF